MNILQTIKMRLDENPKLADHIYKTITFLAAAASVVLVLVMLLTGRSGNQKPDTGHSPISISDGTGRPSVVGEGNPDGTTGRNDQPNDKPVNPSPSDSSRPTSLTLTVTDQEASELIAFSLADRLPMENVQVFFSAPDIIEIQGTIQKDKVGSLIGDQNRPLLRAALILAPDTLDGSLSFRLSLDEEGQLTASPTKVIVNNINITRLIPDSAVRSANEALSSLLPEEVRLRSLSIDDGSITFTLEA